MVASIEISRLNFQENKNVIVPVNAVNTVQVLANSEHQTNCYEFRDRKRKQESSVGPPAKRSRALVVPNEVKPKLIVAKKESLREGQFVLAKMKTYPEWPAKILSFGKSYVNVYFFGDQTTGNVSFENIGMLKENNQIMRINLRKKIRGYAKAVRCVELASNIPDHLSLLNGL